MKFSKVIEAYKPNIDCNIDFDITSITDDSRNIQKGSMFIAIDGYTHKGSDFIDTAIAKGASIIVVQKGIAVEGTQNIVYVENTRDFYSYALFKFNENIIPKHIFSITGTNGKSSTAGFISQILWALNKPNMLLGTLGTFIDAHHTKNLNISNLTTPSSADLIKSFSIAKEHNIDYLVTESSSHAIAQSRFAHISFDSVGFTNLSQDHLDYHKNMQAYFDTKKRLFLEASIKYGVVINIDHDYGKQLSKECKEKDIKVITYGKIGADALIEKIDTHDNAQKVTFAYGATKYNFTLNMLGEFQVYNILCAIMMLHITGIDLNTIVAAIGCIKPVEGRLQQIDTSRLKIDAKIFIDFAHTPDALENVLNTFKTYKEQGYKLKILFGAGGDRDKTKRPIMGNIAYQNADEVYVTDDNPRTENAENIREEIISGMDDIDTKKVFNVADREAAIKLAINNLQNKDILIIAGKGHERGQIIGNTIIDFHDKDVVESILEGEICKII